VIHAIYRTLKSTQPFSIVGRLALASASCLLVLMAVTITCAAAAPAVVHLSLDRYPKVSHVNAGDSVGVGPAVLTVHVGDSIIFVNDDAVAHHTATGLVGATLFGEPRWTQAVLKPFGNIGSQQWSSGDIAPGARSAPLLASTPGTFLYGCFFHYSAGMRGEIIVEP
jgi:plastocyanin